MTITLKPKYEGRKSYYGKAEITINERNNINKSIHLYSYGTYIMKISKEYIHFEKNEGLYTATTLRHIRELLKQYAGSHNIKPISKRIIIKNGYIMKNIYNCRRNWNNYKNLNQCRIGNYL